jgi:hypothetical protein
MIAHPDFLEASAANARVRRSLYQRANGYNYEAVKIFMPTGAKKPVCKPSPPPPSRERVNDYQSAAALPNGDQHRRSWTRSVAPSSPMQHHHSLGAVRGGAPSPDKPPRTLGAIGGRSAAGPFHSRRLAAILRCNAAREACSYPAYKCSISYSTTSSAMARSVGGTSRPSAFRR